MSTGLTSLANFFSESSEEERSAASAADSVFSASIFSSCNAHSDGALSCPSARFPSPGIPNVPE
ncbi:hypothetical protein HanIR_Chr09g0429931 [Helianthus annuus]|nr:hypothetical protein HanIR_Chr09g0429931 [Helianthus annuus]